MKIFLCNIFARYQYIFIEKLNIDVVYKEAYDIHGEIIGFGNAIFTDDKGASIYNLAIEERFKQEFNKR